MLRTGDFVTIKSVVDKYLTLRRVSTGFYKRYEIDVPQIIIQNDIIVNLIDSNSKSHIVIGTREEKPYILPKDWMFMSIEDAHVQYKTQTVKSVRLAPQIRFHTSFHTYDFKEVLTTKLLKNVIAIEIMNCALFVKSESGEERTFYNTVHALCTYMDNRDIRMDRCYWGLDHQFVSKNSFNIIEQDKPQAPTLLIDSPDKVYVDVYKNILEIAPFKVQDPALFLTSYGGDLNVSYIFPGFYDRHKMYDVFNTFININSVSVKSDEKVKVTVIYKNDKYETYEPQNGRQNVPDDVVYMAIQISHTPIFNKNSDVVINIYTRTKKYTHTDMFEKDDLENVISIELINAQITFVNNLSQKHQFFNTVYFLPTYVGNNNIMDMLESTWIDATDNKNTVIMYKVKFR